MSYNISSENLNNPLLKDLLKELTRFFGEIGVDFYVIGATARDIILSNLHGLTPDRKTEDLDIAIAIADWKQFQAIEASLPEKESFEKSTNQKQRFIYKGVYVVDIVPFGEVAKEDGNIYWPPDETIAMSVWGFPEMADSTISIEIDEEFSIKIASLPGLFILKLVAWKDRHLLGSKDAYDMALLLTNYLYINTERAVKEHYDLYETDEFDQVIVGAQLMARDVKLLMRDNENTLEYLQEILAKEIELAEESQLINQLVESDTSLQYEQVLVCLESMFNEWSKYKDMEQNKEYTTEDVVLEDNQLICALTKKIKTASEKELTLQSMIMMLSEEYNFDLNDMERDFSFSYEDDEGKTKRAKADLAIFESGKGHDADNMIRIAIVFDSKVKDKDPKKGVFETLGVYLESTDCEFGVWTNGNDLHYLQCEKDDFGQAQTSDISDFPGKGQSMQDLESAGERAHPRKPTNDSLVKTFKRCHDYIYGNEGRKKDAFWELLNLIFCKIYDEKRRFIDAENGKSYRRKFWVGVKEQNHY
jgi:predicted nucleotidyltransferase